ncbi:hypothetical protein EDB81DRAFT_872576 [Dactylonectria macrodidyma]|uniref:Protein CAP22 n=1 Tax=Dactylonectria macrodidyma TaxID=307937 RepID=A0A9P9DPL6_9HYPO|nr:hypothetical protein EDB81DRAFT_872576 [Dactylonectria macrodidyma]
MYANKIALAVAPLLLAVAHADLQLDNDDVPNACKAICKPIVTLTQACEVDLSGSDDTDRNENRLEAQCVCTNDSFDVANIAGLCADCMRQNNNDNNDDDDDDDDDDNDWDDGDLSEIRDILSTCGWPTSSYASASSTVADGITVDATAPTALSQLTTTIVPGSTRSGSGSGSGTTATGSANPTQTGSTSGSNDDTASSTGSDAASSASESAAQASETDNAAAALAPLGVAGFAVAGAFLMLA